MSALKSVFEFPYAFLFAAMGFKKPSDAEEYQRGSRVFTTVSPEFAPSNEPRAKPPACTAIPLTIKQCNKEYEPLTTPRATYVLSEWADEFSTNMITLHQAGPKPLWHPLSRTTNPKPSTAYNVALMLEGPSKVYLADRLCDCYCTWSRTDGKTFEKAVWEDPTGTRRLFAARSGSGIVYARVLHYKNGEPVRLDTHMLAVEFSILDRDPAKDDMLRLYFKQRSVSFSDRPEVPREPLCEQEMPLALRCLLADARVGFQEFCRPINPEVEKQILNRHDQNVKYRAAFQKYQSWAPKRSAYGRLHSASLQVALDWVKEPWQLRMVVSTISGRREFWEHPQYDGAMYVHVRNMLAKYKCTPERRMQLDEMIRTYVEPSFGKQWSYTGD